MDQQRDINITDRQRQILAIIVEQYVSTARPVASEHITGSYELNVSSATVRNEMVELEKAGLIAQPHTSAGRVPSDRGYRYFVENLMTPTALSTSEQRTIRHQFHQIEMDVEEWVRLATAVLARTVHTAAVATAPRSTAVRLKHFEFLSISDVRILIVLVGHDSTVTQQMLTLDESWDQASLSSLSTRLNAAFQGKTGAEIDAWLKDESNARSLPALAREVLVPYVVAMLSRMQRPETAQIYHEGLGHILAQPEFHHPERVQQLLELFEQDSVWSSLISSVLTQDGVQVIIGDERHGTGMAACGVVLARYGFEDQMAGVLGVIGPMRMPYSRSVSTVSYISGLLSDLLYRAHNPQLLGGEE
ncbi:MAG: heat-inducible transcriptional repressor HrcA [Chloroflexia bacterium]